MDRAHLPELSGGGLNHDWTSKQLQGACPSTQHEEKAQIWIRNSSSADWRLEKSELPPAQTQIPAAQSSFNRLQWKQMDDISGIYLFGHSALAFGGGWMEGKPRRCFLPSHVHPVDVISLRLILAPTTSSQPEWWWSLIMWHYITLTGFDTLPNHVFRDIIFFIPSSAAKWLVVPPDVIHKCQHLFSSIVMKRWLDRWFRNKMKLGGRRWQ